MISFEGQPEQSGGLVTDVNQTGMLVKLNTENMFCFPSLLNLSHIIHSTRSATRHETLGICRQGQETLRGDLRLGWGTTSPLMAQHRALPVGSSHQRILVTFLLKPGTAKMCPSAGQPQADGSDEFLSQIRLVALTRLGQHTASI